LITEIISEMYKTIMNIKNGEYAKYTSSHDKIFFEKINLDNYDGTYCLMEWFTPVIEN